MEFFPVHALPELDLYRARAEHILHAYRVFTGATAEVLIN